MYITHLHPSLSSDGPEGLTDLLALHRSCLSALQRYRNAHAPLPSDTTRTR